VISIGGEDFTGIVSGATTTQFNVGGDAIADAASLAYAINNNTTLATAGYSAAIDGGNLTISRTGVSLTAGQITGTALTSGITASTDTVPDVYTGMTTVEIGDVVLTGTTNIAGGTNQFYVSGNAAADAAALAAAISSFVTTQGYTATVSGSTVTVAHASADIVLNTDITGSAVTGGAAVIASAIVTGVDETTYTAGQEISLGGVTLTATTGGTPGTNEFYVGGNAAADAQALAAAINSVVTTEWDAGTYTATASGATVNISHTISSALTSMATTEVTTVPTEITVSEVAGSDELSVLETQYNNMLTQITALAGDSGYKGKNLLSGGDLLTVQFEGTSAKLDIQGFDYSTAAGLGLSSATWASGGSIAGDIVFLDGALNSLRSAATSLSGNLSVITVRQDFSTNMINTLTEGSNKLTLADTNEEGANMLMLQTRQSLSTTALSLSAQAAQSVLRLFQ